LGDVELGRITENCNLALRTRVAKISGARDEPDGVGPAVRAPRAQRGQYGEELQSCGVVTVRCSFDKAQPFFRRVRHAAPNEHHAAEFALRAGVARRGPMLKRL